MSIEGFTPFPREFQRKYRNLSLWKGRTLGGVLAATAKRLPDKEALVDDRSRVTYAELDRLVTRLAAAFLDLGIRKSDRVTVQLPNWNEFVYTFFALARIGAIPVMALPAHRTREVEHLIRLTDSVALICPAQFRNFDYVDMAREIQPGLPTLRHVVLARGEAPGMVAFDQLLGHPYEEKHTAEEMQAQAPYPDDVALILTTGGTTGFPKGVPRAHDEYIYNGEVWGQGHAKTESSVVLIAIPIGHNAAIVVSLVPAVTLGAKIVLVPRTDSETVCEAIQREKVTCVTLVPTMAVDLVNFPRLGEYDISSLRNVGCGAAHVPPELVRALTAKTGARVSNSFGMAEGPCSCTRPGDPFEWVCETVGRPLSKYDEYVIVDDDGRHLPPGQEGELICRGPYTFRGYYKAPEANAEGFTEDGFFRSGDYASIDEHGNIRITGRKKDVIIRGGENISAAEIEGLLMEHPKVQDAAVVGMPDPRLGERACAFVKLKPGQKLELAEVVEFLRGKQIAAFKLPERLEVVEEFPLSNVGKVLKRTLVDQIKEKLKAEGAL